jgi:hypothetical protein
MMSLASKQRIIRMLARILPSSDGEPHWFVDYISYDGNPRSDWNETWFAFTWRFLLLFFVMGHFICKGFGWDIPIFLPHF